MSGFRMPPHLPSVRTTSNLVTEAGSPKVLVTAARRISAAETAAARASSAQSLLGRCVGGGVDTSPESLTMAEIVEYSTSVKTSVSLLAKMNASAVDDDKAGNAHEKREALKQLPQEVRSLKVAVRAKAQLRKEAKKNEKEKEALQRLEKRAHQKAARRAKEPVSKSTTSNMKGSYFRLAVVPMIERRFLVDAIDMLKAGKPTEYPSDEAAGAEVQGRIVSGDPFYARKLASGSQVWHTKGRISRWRHELAADILRTAGINAVQRRTDPTQEMSPLDKSVAHHLKELADRGLLFSIAIACNWIDHNPKFVRAKIGFECPFFKLSRSHCYSVMRRTGLGLSPFSVEELQTSDVLSVKKGVCAELAYLARNPASPISDAVIYNLDETSLRLFPEHTRAWCYRNDFRSAGFRATKAYTTVVCCLNAAGDILRAQVNWKGSTDGCLAFKGDKSKRPRLWEFVTQCSGDSYWTTTDSLMHYIETVIVPHWEANRATPGMKFILTLDYAPSHKSYETRKAFHDKFGTRGYLVFIPKRCTNHLQPLDVGCFGELKPLVKASQTSIVVSGAMEFSMVAWGVPRVKELVLESVASGVEQMRRHYRTAERKEEFANRCWGPLFLYKDGSSFIEASKMHQSRDYLESAYFEYGVPGLEPLEKARKMSRAGDADDEDNEIFIEVGAGEIPDLPDCEDGCTPTDEGLYYAHVSDNEDLV